jgi:hypothetical protein
VLVALAAVLVAALAALPRVLSASGPGEGLGDGRHLAQAFREAFIEYWNAGDRDFSPGMERVVDYWFRFHVVKAVIGAILLIVLVALGVLLWKAFLGAGGLGAGVRAAIASAGVLVTMLALRSSVMVKVSIQSVIAPFGSMLPMLTEDATDRELANTLGQVRRRLADSVNAGAPTSPALEVMINEYSLYHLVIVVVGPIMAVVLVGMSVVLWKRFARTESSDRRTRHVLGSFGVLTILLSLFAIVVSMVNMATVADPGPRFLLFFDGSW